MQLLRLLLAVAALASLAATGAAARRHPRPHVPNVYKVYVGAENNTQGVEVNAFFPLVVRVRVGDAVVFEQNSREIHTVTFLAAGAPVPPLIVPVGSDLAINPAIALPVGGNGPWDGTGMINSGLMTTLGGLPTVWNVTFTRPGMYKYVCVVHAKAMIGYVQVVGGRAKVFPPNVVETLAQLDMSVSLAVGNAGLAEINKQTLPPTPNGDGTSTHYVVMGGSLMFGGGGGGKGKGKGGKGKMMAMKGKGGGNKPMSPELMVDYNVFVPKTLSIKRGDKVKFVASSINHGEVPHTVAFLNGAAVAPFVLPKPQTPPNPPLLTINPAVLVPQRPGQPYTRSGVYQSGLLSPGANYTIGFPSNMNPGAVSYVCQLHAAVQMDGIINVMA